MSSGSRQFRLFAASVRETVVRAGQPGGKRGLRRRLNLVAGFGAASKEIPPTTEIPSLAEGSGRRSGGPGETDYLLDTFKLGPLRKTLFLASPAEAALGCPGPIGVLAAAPSGEGRARRPRSRSSEHPAEGRGCAPRPRSCQDHDRAGKGRGRRRKG